MAFDKILTIIIPSYNMEKYLPKCLGSLIVAPELMERIEVIVVNDGSTDRTSEIAHEFAANYPQTFKVIDKSNGHYGSCINTALPIAVGTFIKILDADDTFDTISFEKLILHLDSLPVDTDMIMTDYATVNDEGVQIGICSYPLPTDKFLCAKDLVDYKCGMAMHAVCYRRALLIDIGYHQTEGLPYTDTEWFYLPPAKCKKIYYYPICLYRYLLGRPGQSVDKAVWVTSPSIGKLESIFSGMVFTYERVMHDASYEKLYIEFQLCRMLNLLIELNDLYANIGSAITFFHNLSKLCYRHPFLYDVMDRFVVFSSLRIRFKYVRFMIMHKWAVRGVIIGTRVYRKLLKLLWIGGR